MKKKSKIFNKLFTVFVAVLCMAMLCVPAFASSGTVILPETTFVYEQEYNGVMFEYSFPLVEGYEYTVVINGVSYSCVCWSQEVDDDGLFYCLGSSDIDNPEYPFMIVSGVDTAASFFVFLISDFKDGDTFTVAIYADSPSDSLFGDISSMVDFSIGWIGQFVEVVTSNALLLCFCVVMFVGLGIGLIARIKR